MTPDDNKRRKVRAQAIIHRMSNADMRDALEGCSGASATGMSRTTLRHRLVQAALDCGYSIPIEDYEVKEQP